MRAEDTKLIICCQISHASIFSNQQNPLDVNTATVEELSNVVDSFQNAARRAQEAGYDCIQIHAAHGYLLSRSLSKLLNTRSDMYAADQFKLLSDVFDAVKTITSIPIGVKLQSNDFIENGMNEERFCEIVKKIKFDFIEISGGSKITGAKYMVQRKGTDTYYYQQAVQQLKLNNLLEDNFIIVTGGFENVLEAKAAFDDGVSMVGFSRKFIRNPRFLINDDSKCVRCGGCSSAPSQCVFNKQIK